MVPRFPETQKDDWAVLLTATVYHDHFKSNQPIGNELQMKYICVSLKFNNNQPKSGPMGNTETDLP